MAFFEHANCILVGRVVMVMMTMVMHRHLHDDPVFVMLFAVIYDMVKLGMVVPPIGESPARTVHASTHLIFLMRDMRVGHIFNMAIFVLITGDRSAQHTQCDTSDKSRVASILRLGGWGHRESRQERGAGARQQDFLEHKMSSKVFGNDVGIASVRR